MTIPESVAVACRNLHVGYGGGSDVVRGVDLTVGAGETVAIMGASGSGKSSLLYALAGLLRPTQGDVVLAATSLGSLSEDERCALRRSKVGLVFQFGELVPELSLLENVALPLRIVGQGRRAAEAAARAALASLGVDESADRRAGQVSGGQAQRAAIARSMIHRPAVVFADEPTGALDSDHADQVLALLFDAVEARGTTLVMVTHDRAVAARAPKVLHFADGRFVDSETAPSVSAGAVATP